MHAAGVLVLTHSTHCSLDFCFCPLQVHAAPHLHEPLHELQSENGHALAIASLTWSIVMVPQPQPLPHVHCLSFAAHEQSTHLSQEKFRTGEVAAVAAMVKGCRCRRCGRGGRGGDKRGYVR